MMAIITLRGDGRYCTVRRACLDFANYLPSFEHITVYFYSKYAFSYFARIGGGGIKNIQRGDGANSATYRRLWGLLVDQTRWNPELAHFVDISDT